MNQFAKLLQVISNLFIFKKKAEESLQQTHYNFH